MAFSYQQHGQQSEHTTTPSNTNNHNFDAPLIGDLKLDANNNNNTMNDPIIYHNDEPDALTNPLYDHDDTMSTFGMSIDSNMYGSPPLAGFDQYHPLRTPITPMPTMMHLDTSPVPPFVATTNNSHTTDDISANTNNNHTDNSANDAPFDGFHHMDMDNDTPYYPYNDDHDNDDMFDTIKYTFSSQSEFPIDQSTLLAVSDGISQFLNTSNTSIAPIPSPSAPNTNPQSTNPNHPYTTTPNNYHTNYINTNPFGTPPQQTHTINAPNHTQTPTQSRPSSSSSSNSSSSTSSSSSSSSASSSSSSSSSSSTASSSSSEVSLSGNEDEDTMEFDTDMTPTTAKPRKYIEIKRNLFVHRKKNKPNHGYQYKCDCHYTANGDDCDKNACYNKLFYYECTSSASCSVQDETGDAKLCQNRRFQRGEWKKVRVAASGKKGWGLFADQRIEKGEFVVEYVGEVITENECKQRLATAYLHQTKFYILKLEGGKKGESIDATVKGGPARFMNHSCEPNCKAQKWTVGGELCLGFFADIDIKKGEELTFDYQFQRYGAMKQKCYCGSKNCRKYLGADAHRSPHKLRAKTSSDGVVRRGYRKNAKIVQRNMDRRIIIKQCYDYLMRLADNSGIDVQDAQDTEDGVLHKCMAKGRLLRRQYINSSTGDMLRQFKQANLVSFEEIIQPLEGVGVHGDDGTDPDTESNVMVLREPENGESLLNVEAMNEFENVVCGQYKSGYDFELEHLEKLPHINEKLNSEAVCGEQQKCTVCLLYGYNSCRTVPVHHAQGGNGDGGEEVKKQYLKLKQVSQRKVMEQKIKNSHKKKRKGRRLKRNNNEYGDAVHDADGGALCKDQSDADSAYAANLHEQLNKPHLRSRRTRSCTNKAVQAEKCGNTNTTQPPNTAPVMARTYSQTKGNQFDALTGKSMQTLKKHKNGLIGDNKAAIESKKKGADVVQLKHNETVVDDVEDVDDIDVCDKCGVSKDSLKTKGTWSRHLHSKHTYYCKQCVAQFTTAVTLSEHEKATHRDAHKVTHKTSKVAVLNHAKTSKVAVNHKDGLPDKCVKCGRDRGDTPKSHWNKHIQTDHRYPCPHCEYRFAHRKKYNEHFQLSHCIDMKSENKKKLKSAEDTDDDDVDMKMDDNNNKMDNNIEKKRKYSHFNEEQPRKRRKLNNIMANDNNVLDEEEIFKNDETIKLYMDEREKELKLYQFVDFEGYEEDEELMVSIYDKMNKNDLKYSIVFEKEECLNTEIIDTMKYFHPNTSIFNALIFPTNKNKKNPTLKPQPVPIRNIEPIQQPQQPLLLHGAQITPQSIIIRQSQPIQAPKKTITKTNNAHFSAANMKISHKSHVHHTNYNNHRYNTYNTNNHHSNKSHHSNNSTPNSSHTPISHASQISHTSHTSSSHSRSNSSHSSNRTNYANHDRRRNNHHHHNNYHHSQSHHHYHTNHRHNTTNNNNRYNSYNNNKSATHYAHDPDNKTLFVDNIPMGVTLKSLESALKKNGSIKEIILRTKQNQQSQYANVTCYQRHICDSLIIAGRKPIPLQLSDGQIIHPKLTVHYHNQQKVDDAREKRRKEIEERIKHQ